MSDHDDKLDRAYRALASEEPPAKLDAAILAASRRAVAKPSLARRWGVPVSLAAMLVLAIGVTLEMQREKPGIELSEPAAESAPAPQAAPAPPEKREQAAPSESQERPTAPAPKREAKRAAPAMKVPAPETKAAAPAMKAPAPATKDQAATAPEAEAPAAAGAAPRAPSAQGQLLAPEAGSAKRAAAANATADAITAAADPRAELERIAKLRAEGRDEEADRALEAFRRRFPHYRIDDATWERVRPR